MLGGWRQQAGAAAVLAAVALFAVCCGPKRAALYDLDIELNEAPVGDQVQRETVAGQLSAGCAALRSGKPGVAKARFEAHLRKHPTSAMAHYELGRVAALRGDHDEARQRFERAVTLEPNLFGALSNLGLVFSQSRESIAAVNVLERALSIARDDARVLNNLGNAWALRRRFADAQTAYNRALKAAPEHGTMLYNQALLHLERRDSDAALKSLQTALAVRPGFALARALRISALQQRGDLAQAKRLATLDLTAIEPLPDNHLALGRVLIALGEVTEGVAQLREAAQLGPKHGPSLFALAEALEATQDKEGAAKLYRRYLKLTDRRFEEARHARRRLRSLQAQPPRKTKG